MFLILRNCNCCSMLIKVEKAAITVKVGLGGLERFHINRKLSLPLQPLHSPRLLSLCCSCSPDSSSVSLWVKKCHRLHISTTDQHQRQTEAFISLHNSKYSCLSQVYSVTQLWLFFSYTGFIRFICVFQMLQRTDYKTRHIKDNVHRHVRQTFCIQS